MKRLFIWMACFTMVSTFIRCEATICTAKTIEEVCTYFDGADHQTLAIFDVDMCLTQPSNPYFQIPSMREHAGIMKKIYKGLPPEKRMLFLAYMTITSDTILVEDTAPAVIKQLQSHKVLTMALTANLTGRVGNIACMEQKRFHDLANLGIDFTNNCPTKERIIFEDLPRYRGNCVSYANGILTVNGLLCPKGQALLAFLAKTNLCPKRIIFIDDLRENLVEVEDALKKRHLPIEFIGLHYLAAENYPSQKVSEADFERVWLEYAEMALKSD